MSLGMFDRPSAGPNVRVTIGNETVDAKVDGYGSTTGDEQGEPFLCATGPIGSEFELWDDGVAELIVDGEQSQRGTWRWA